MAERHPQARKSTILAKTWNQNESGTLWTREWYREGEGDEATFHARTIASGAFTQPIDFGTDVTAFWAAYAEHARKFYGRSVH